MAPYPAFFDLAIGGNFRLLSRRPFPTFNDFLPYETSFSLEPCGRSTRPGSRSRGAGPDHGASSLQVKRDGIA